MVNGRNLQQPGVSVPGTSSAGVDCGARMMSSVHGMGMVAGLNRGMSGARPGFPRISSPAMLNAVSSGSLMPNSVQGVLNAVSVHPGAISGPGNSILRPRDPMQTFQLECLAIYYCIKLTSCTYVTNQKRCLGLPSIFQGKKLLLR